MLRPTGLFLLLLLLTFVGYVFWVPSSQEPKIATSKKQRAAVKPGAEVKVKTQAKGQTPLGAGKLKVGMYHSEVEELFGRRASILFCAWPNMGLGWETEEGLVSVCIDFNDKVVSITWPCDD